MGGLTDKTIMNKDNKNIAGSEMNVLLFVEVIFFFVSIGFDNQTLKQMFSSAFRQLKSITKLTRSQSGIRLGFQ